MKCELIQPDRIESNRRQIYATLRDLVLRVLRREFSMPYFDPATNKSERIGRVAGDILATAIVLALIIVFVVSMASR